MFKGITLILLISFLITCFSIAYAHKPLEAQSANNRLEDAVQIPDHKISWAIYQDIQDGSEVDYYSFNAKRGDDLYVEMTIPKLAGLESFRPSIALIGDDINSTMLVEGDNANIALAEVWSDTQSNHILPFEVPANTTTVIGRYKGAIPSTEFYEPFTQTSYWERQKLIIQKLPTTGTYYLAVFDEQHNVLKNGPGKYTLAVGKIEDFSFIDYIVTLPVAWFTTKFFFNDYATPSIAIAIILAIPSSIVALSYHSKSNRSGS